MSLSAADLPSMFPPPTPAMPSQTPDRRAGEIPLQFRHRGTFRASEFGGALPRNPRVQDTPLPFSSRTTSPIAGYFTPMTTSLNVTTIFGSLGI